ncbi:MAG: type II CRISPR RNA-guided endonuclease Cas9 [Agathobaculum desmolans]|uniref:type II CRISPR RNA-guided endonuclease Cas9 n=1 Tax=Agathobaculum desmolans TaxID=39484 RepID=UPI0039920EE1
MQYSGEYYIGLNISDTAVGWAVTDPSYHLLKANQKSLWGVRLFDRADTAEERRLIRHKRRQIERKQQRIRLLQSLFSDEIGKIDPAFFQRLRESKFARVDKQGVSGPYALFADSDYTDRDYHRQYPTIYHLRKALLTENHPFDVRLVYLAVHHIFKHRGHFLNDAPSSEGVPSFPEVLHALHAALASADLPTLELKDEAAFEAALRNASLGKPAKKKLLLSTSGVGKRDAIPYAIIELLAGNKVDLRVLYPNDHLKSIKISLDTLQDEEQSASLDAMLGSRLEILLRIKAVADWAAVANFLNGERYLSFAKVAQYEKHKADLALLKREIRQYLPEQYHEIFHLEDAKCNNYPAYSGHQNTGTRCDYSQFKSYLRSQLQKIPSPSENVRKIMQEMDQNTFLPLQTVIDNRVLPHQVHRCELVAILHRAERYLPFLKNTDEYNLSVSDKTICAFDFVIPYYVGPANTSSPYAWVIRKNDKIYPWNFEQTVDLPATAERFMSLRTAKCPFLGFDVLPKDSLLYSEFAVLQALNNIRINGSRLSQTQKELILQDFFHKHKRVTRDTLVQFLLASGTCQSAYEILGLDDDFDATLRSHIVFRPLLSRINDPNMVEDLIRHIVLFGQDKKLLRQYIKQAYGSRLTEKEIQYVCQQSFSGWGSMSKEFLTEIYHTDPATGEAFSILDMMRHTNATLSELLSAQYDFHHAVQAFRQNEWPTNRSPETYLDIRNPMPSARRAVTQTSNLVAEIIKIMHRQKPTRIFITSPDKNGSWRQSTFLKNTLVERYKACGQLASSLLPNLMEESASSLSIQKRYLYYTQLGRCMYSGQPIDFSLLEDNTQYRIVPIYPPETVADDNLDNCVLIRSDAMNHCSSYPLPADVRQTQTEYWRILLDSRLISRTKYERLINSVPLTPEEGFHHQNGQIALSSHLADLAIETFDWMYGLSTDIRFVKPNTINNLRQWAGNTLGAATAPDFAEYSAVNPLHYAKTAYLSIAAESLCDICRSSVSSSHDRADNLPNTSMCDAVHPHSDTLARTLLQTMRRNNVLLTRKSYEACGALFDQALLPKGKGQAPVKSSDPRMTIDKFGGYNKLRGSYFCFVEHGDENKRVRSLETVYLIYVDLYRRDPIQYCRTILGLHDPCILVPCIKMDALFSYDGFRMHLSGRSGGGKQVTYKNANPLILSSAQNRYIEQLLRFIEHAAGSSHTQELAENYHITVAENIALYHIFELKLASFYGRMHTAPLKAVQTGKTHFAALSLHEQGTVLAQMMNLFACRFTTADLSAIGGSKNGGRLLTINTFSPKPGHKIGLILQSVTGVFEQYIDLLRIQAGEIPTTTS